MSQEKTVKVSVVKFVNEVYEKPRGVPKTTNIIKGLHDILTFVSPEENFSIS